MSMLEKKKRAGRASGAKKTSKKKSAFSRKAKGRKRKKSRTGIKAHPEIIFDSTVGKTDALFVDNPDEKIDPAISEALKELDALEKTNQSSIAPQSAELQQEPVAPDQEKKKSFWQRFFPSKNKNNF